MQGKFVESQESDSDETEGEESKKRQVWPQSDEEADRITPGADDKGLTQRE